jgi:CRISPR-associated protein Csy2
MSRYYLLLPTLKMTGCNWESSHLTRSLPLTAVAGFADRLVYFELTEHAAGAAADLKGFAVCLHEGQIYEGLSKNPLALCKGNGSNPDQADLLNPPIIPEIKGHASLSLVVVLELENKSTLDEWLKTRATAFLQTSRLAGGDVTNIGEPKICANSAALAKEMQRLPPGWFIGDCADLIADEPDPFAVLINAVAWFPVEDKEQQSTTRQNGISRRRQHPDHRWLYATCVGYQLLEPPQSRRNRSHNSLNPDPPVKHAYAEPAHSLAKLVRARGLLQPLLQGESTSDNWLTSNHLLWRWHSDASSRTIYLSTKHFNNKEF